MRISLILLLLSSTTLAFVHLAALKFYLYWQYSWFDMPVHTLGGITIVFALYAIRELLGKSENDAPPLVSLLTFALGVGILWELFELYAGVPIQNNYIFDTAIDLTMDVCGGYLGFLIHSKLSYLGEHSS